MENYRGSQSYLPTFNKLITQYYTALGKFPALVGQLSFYLSVVITILIFSLAFNIEFNDGLFFWFPFFGLFFNVFLFPNIPVVVLLFVIFFTSVTLNHIVLEFFPNIRTSRVKLLLASLIVGFISFVPANIVVASLFLRVPLLLRTG